MPFTKLLILKAFVGIKTSSLVLPPEELYLVSQKSKRSDCWIVNIILSRCPVSLRGSSGCSMTSSEKENQKIQIHKIRNKSKLDWTSGKSTISL